MLRTNVGYKFPTVHSLNEGGVLNGELFFKYKPRLRDVVRSPYDILNIYNGNLYKSKICFLFFSFVLRFSFVAIQRKFIKFKSSPRQKCKSTRELQQFAFRNHEKFSM